MKSAASLYRVKPFASFRCAPATVGACRTVWNRLYCGHSASEPDSQQWVEVAISRSDPDWSIYGMKQTSVNAGQATQCGHFQPVGVRQASVGYQANC
jgi:hypothetical protein